MLRRLILSFTLAFLFALGQQGAVLHEISHFADLAPQTQQQDKAPHSPLCEKCISYGELANALGVNHALPPIISAGFEHNCLKTQPQLAVTTLPYSARAPPLFI